MLRQDTSTAESILLYGLRDEGYGYNVVISSDHLIPPWLPVFYFSCLRLHSCVAVILRVVPDALSVHEGVDRKYAIGFRGLGYRPPIN